MHEPRRFFIHGKHVSSIVDLGMTEVARQLDEGEKIKFSSWVSNIRSLARQMGRDVSSSELRWLWDSMKREPRLAAECAGSFVDDHLQEREVLPVGSKRVIRLGTNAGEPPEDPEPHVILLAPLLMGDRSRGRAECFDVRASLIMKVKPRSISNEASTMGVEDFDRIQDEGDQLRVRVDSLNEAYTKASRRLETWRRSHGGRVYDHLFWVKSPGEKLGLGKIRELVEQGNWEAPEAPEAPEEPPL